MGGTTSPDIAERERAAGYWAARLAGRAGLRLGLDSTVTWGVRRARQPAMGSVKARGAGGPLVHGTGVRVGTDTPPATPHAAALLQDFSGGARLLGPPGRGRPFPQVSVARSRQTEAQTPQRPPLSGDVNQPGHVRDASQGRPAAPLGARSQAHSLRENRGASVSPPLSALASDLLWTVRYRNGESRAP